MNAIVSTSQSAEEYLELGLRDQWHPVLASWEVAANPVGITRLGENIERSVDLYKWTFADSSEMDKVDQYILRVFLFCIMIRIDRSVGPSKFGSIGPA